MKTILLILSLLLTTQVAWAKGFDVRCSSYENCIEKAEKIEDEISKAYGGQTFSLMNHYKSRAILYKLNDIHKELERQRRKESWADCYDKHCATNNCPNGVGCYRTLPCKPCEDVL